MLKRLLPLIFLLLLALPCAAQITQPRDPVYVDSAPSTCVEDRLYIVRSTGVMYKRITGVCTVTLNGAVALPAVVQGDLLYGSAGNTILALAKNTSATRYLSNTGSSNNPAWAQINAANGLTGTTPVVNGGTGAATLTGILQGNGTSAFTPATATNVESPLFCSDAGANDTYACSLSPAIAAYATGTHYRFKANTANTGAASINFNAKGAVTIVKAAGGITTALADNDVRAGQWVDVVYDGTNMQMQSLLGNAPSAGITGSLTATHVPVATGASALGDSPITWDGTNIHATATGGEFEAGGPLTYISVNDASATVNIQGTVGVETASLLLSGGSGGTLQTTNVGTVFLDSGTGTFDAGDANGAGNNTTLNITDSTKKITTTAGTESIALDGVAHTITQTAASGIVLNSGAGLTTIGDILTTGSANSPGIKIGGNNGKYTWFDNQGYLTSYRTSGNTAPTDGTLLIGNNSAGGYREGTLTPGTGISVANGSGSITITNSTPGPSVVCSNTAASTAITGTASKTYFNLNCLIPANTLSAGKTIKLEARGVYSAAAANTVTQTVDLCTVSGCASGTVVQLAATAAATPGLVTNQGWLLDENSNQFTAGATGTIDTQGYAAYQTAALVITFDPTPNTSTATINTTVDQYLSISVTWSSNSGSNTITLRNLKAIVQ